MCVHCVITDRVYFICTHIGFTRRYVLLTFDKDNNEENKAAYEIPKKKAKKNLAIDKARTCDRLDADMDRPTTEAQKKIGGWRNKCLKNSKDVKGDQI